MVIENKVDKEDNIVERGGDNNEEVKNDRDDQDGKDDKGGDRLEDGEE